MIQPDLFDPLLDIQQRIAYCTMQLNKAKKDEVLFDSQIAFLTKELQNKCPHTNLKDNIWGIKGGYDYIGYTYYDKVCITCNKLVHRKEKSGGYS